MVFYLNIPIWHKSGMKNEGRPNKIRELREASGMSQEQLAARIQPKTSQPQIDRLEKGERNLTQGWMIRVSSALNVGPKDLLPEESKLQAVREPADNPHQMVATSNKMSVMSAPGTKSFLDQPRDLPILGSVRAGEVGFFLDQGEVQGMARRPPILHGIKGAFAVYVRDESMMPAFEAGWIVHVHPTRPCKLGDNVVIEMTDGQAFIKRLVRRTEKHVVCQQWNPKDEVRYDRTKVKSVMLVVGSAIEE